MAQSILLTQTKQICLLLTSQKLLANRQNWFDNNHKAHIDDLIRNKKYVKINKNHSYRQIDRKELDEHIIRLKNKNTIPGNEI
jgi:hypothetical protein